MGCCFSKSTIQVQTTPQTHRPHHEPPPLEEESVKEVLSETPISKPHQVPNLMPETKIQMPVVQNPPEKFEKECPLEVSEVVSQLSETCSITESFSTATTATATTTTAATVTEKREDDEATSKHSSIEGTTTNRKWDRSPARKRPHAGESGRERRVKSPARRPEPSPEKKIKASSRVVRGRESSTAANRKRNVGSGGVRRDSGEVSGRRSRSPSCARTVRNGGPSKVGSSSGPKHVVPANGAEKEKEKEKEKKSENEEIVVENDVVSPEECLENPHVSMECFIFL
ncbi:hypothetical protein RJT34_31220 [Clitoria ternatea]|uniref:Uncharacterized protein n=1 Tax=Clitoria ternatea TaxID=43366 RepID=A0AAN9ETX0_CLITE